MASRSVSIFVWPAFRPAVLVRSLFSCSSSLTHTQSEALLAVSADYFRQTYSECEGIDHE